MSKNTNKSETTSTFIDPEKYVVDIGTGKKIEFTVSHIPAMKAQRILMALQSDDDAAREEAESDLLSYAAHNDVVLLNESVIENHVPQLKALILLKEKMKAYNFGFFTEDTFQKEWSNLHPAERSE